MHELDGLETQQVILKSVAGDTLLMESKLHCDPMLQEVVEYLAGVPAPVQKNLEEGAVEDEAVQLLLELGVEDVVVVVQQNQDLR